MKITQLFKGILQGIRESLKRFPAAIGLSTACVVLLIYMSESRLSLDENSRKTLERIIMILALGIPLSLCIKLYFERLSSFKSLWLYLSYLVGVGLLILYYFFLLKDFNMVSITRYVGVSLILYLAFLFIPYLKDREEFEQYVLKIFTRFFTTVIYSIVLFLGLAAILFTIDKLLGIKIKKEIYYYTWLIVVGVFAPSFLLAGIPLRNDHFTLSDYPKLFRVLILYIVMPLISVYTIILYIYFGKIIITRQWPNGLVSHLVLWYSAISSGVLFFITPLLKEKQWPKKFMNIFPKLILPLIIMMFISIGIRINAYGVTENRYFVVALGIWVFLTMLYFSFVRKLRNILVLVSLAVITFVSVFGPVSSYSLSKVSQNKRLQGILIRNNMLKDNTVIKASSSISKEDSRNITNILGYFNQSHSLRDLKYLPETFKIGDIEKVLGIKPEYEYYTNNNYFFFRINGSTPIDVKGYDFLIDGRNMGSIGSASYRINYDYSLNKLELLHEGKVIYAKDINEFTNTLINKYGMSTNKETTLDAKEMSFEDENDIIKIKVQFISLSGNKNASTDKVENNSSDFIVLIKVK